jgi:SulP family sulfate permease
VPLCALAAILFVVAWNMSEPRKVARMARTAPRADVAILLITFVLTVLTDLVIAVNIGVILAMLQFLRRMASSVAVVRQGDAELRHELNMATALPQGMQVYSVDGPLFFGAVEGLDRSFGTIAAETHVVIIRLRHVPFMDITGINALEDAIRQLAQRGIAVHLCEANLRLLRKLLRAGVVKRGQPPLYFGRLSRAIAEVKP